MTTKSPVLDCDQGQVANKADLGRSLGGHCLVGESSRAGGGISPVNLRNLIPGGRIPPSSGSHPLTRP